VTFEVLPAIDVAGGRLVRVSGGDVRPTRAFGGSPLVAARAFVEAGARRLHVVDVDRASGAPPDLDLIRALATAGAPIQASGGIASREAAVEALEAGADRVVLSSSVLVDHDLAAGLVHDLAERAVVGIEADGRSIRPRGGDAALPLAATLARLRSIGPARYLYTGLSRVATLAGPDLDGLRAGAAILGRPVLAAGGIRSVDDVCALRDLGPSVVEGCVIGRALYEGLDLSSVDAALR
jgi:phosphoribosylformimino-5-aminoimidazole carboxamide ribonucleotide (ProFAR) isomerase